uniref:Secreted protein n=1 Tax=Steinernema glaseri TaxID=37863 RepID=A0A1I7XZR5_9BILA
MHLYLSLLAAQRPPLLRQTPMCTPSFNVLYVFFPVPFFAEAFPFHFSRTSSGITYSSQVKNYKKFLEHFGEFHTPGELIMQEPPPGGLVRALTVTTSSPR